MMKSEEKVDKKVCQNIENAQVDQSEKSLGDNEKMSSEVKENYSDTSINEIESDALVN